MIRKKRFHLNMDTREAMAGYLFVAPLMLGLIFLTLIPVLGSLLLSFTDWNFVAGLGGLSSRAWIISSGCFMMMLL